MFSCLLHKGTDEECDWVTIEGHAVCIKPSESGRDPGERGGHAHGTRDVMIRPEGAHHRVVPIKDAAQWREAVGRVYGVEGTALDSKVRTFGGFYDPRDNTLRINPVLDDPASEMSVDYRRNALDPMGFGKDVTARQFVEWHETGHAVADAESEERPGAYGEGSVFDAAKEDGFPFTSYGRGSETEGFADFYAFYRSDPGRARGLYPTATAQVERILRGMKGRR